MTQSRDDYEDEVRQKLRGLKDLTNGELKAAYDADADESDNDLSDDDFDDDAGEFDEDEFEDDDE